MSVDDTDPEDTRSRHTAADREIRRATTQADTTSE